MQSTLHLRRTVCAVDEYELVQQAEGVVESLARQTTATTRPRNGLERHVQCFRRSVVRTAVDVERVLEADVQLRGHHGVNTPVDDRNRPVEIIQRPEHVALQNDGQIRPTEERHVDAAQRHQIVRPDLANGIDELHREGDVGPAVLRLPLEVAVAQVDVHRRVLGQAAGHVGEALGEPLDQWRHILTALVRLEDALHGERALQHDRRRARTVLADDGRCLLGDDRLDIAHPALGLLRREAEARKVGRVRQPYEQWCRSEGVGELPTNHGRGSDRVVDLTLDAKHRAGDVHAIAVEGVLRQLAVLGTTLLGDTQTERRDQTLDHGEDPRLTTLQLALRQCQQVVAERRQTAHALTARVERHASCEADAANETRHNGPPLCSVFPRFEDYYIIYYF